MVNSASPSSTSEWLAARSALANRRIARTVFLAIATFAGALGAVASVSRIGESPGHPLALRLGDSIAAPPAAVVVAAAILAVIVGFTLGLAAEMARPKVASAREAERVTGIPVVATVRARDRELKQGDLDAFQLLYLGLTAVGAQVRAVAIAGENRATVAEVGGRLALAAADDARAALVIDADAEGSAVAGYFRERPEPGFSDAVRGVRLWREVTRPARVAAEIAIDVVPGGAIRRDALDDGMREAARVELHRFAGQYDLCVLVAPSADAFARLVEVFPAPVTVLVVELGRMTLDHLRQRVDAILAAGASLHGIVLWDDRAPMLPSRKALMTAVPRDAPSTTRP